MVKVLYIHSFGNDYRDKRIINELVKNDQIELVVADYETVLWSLKKDHHKIDADCVINMHRNIELSKMLEEDGVKCFNTPSSTLLATDKWNSYLKLNEINIPQPKTSLSQDFKAPFIYKDRYGSLGKNVFLIENNRKITNTNNSYIFQEYIEECCGESVRVFLINKQPIAWVLKRNTKDFKSNLAQGGKEEDFDLTSDVAEMCIKTAEHLNLDYCAIDLLMSKRGPLVLEVNSRAGLLGIETYTKINIAKIFVDYIIDSISL